MKFRVEVTQAAQEQIRQIYLQYKQEFPSLADSWFIRLFQTLDTLKQFPHRCPLAPENDEFEEEVRQLLYGKRRTAYRILFSVQKGTVYVLHVRHHAQARLTAEDSSSEPFDDE